MGTYAQMVKYKKVITLKCWLLGVVGTYAQMFKCKKVTTPNSVLNWTTNMWIG